MSETGNRRTSKTAVPERKMLTREEADARNTIAREGLRTFYENLVRDSETPCSQCFDGNYEVCEECEWEDYESCGLWVLDGDSEVLESEYESAEPRKHPSNPIRHSEALSEWIIPGSCMPYVSGTDLLFMLDEYEMFAGFCYDYRIAGSKWNDEHTHSFDAIVVAMMDDPEHFYIPKRAEGQYSQQELLFLEVVRERMCTDAGTEPVCPLVCARDESDELAEGADNVESAWEVAVRNRIETLRQSRAEKRAQASRAAEQQRRQ